MVKYKAWRRLVKREVETHQSALPLKSRGTANFKRCKNQADRAKTRPGGFTNSWRHIRIGYGAHFRLRTRPTFASARSGGRLRRL
jgi:hypothetical protein